MKITLRLYVCIIFNVCKCAYTVCKCAYTVYTLKVPTYVIFLLKYVLQLNCGYTTFVGTLQYVRVK